MKKKYYEGEFVKSLHANGNFLVRRFQDEWDAIQRAERRRGRMEKFKAGGKTVGKILLGFLAVGGVFTVMMVAPKVFVVFGEEKRRRMFIGEDDFRKSKRNFRKQGLVKCKQGDDSALEIFATEKGEKRALGEMYRDLRLGKSAKRDGLWRVVVFDIPERKKVERDGFRWKLNQMGFYRLQDSVFVSPYPCEKEIDFLISVFGIGAYVHIFTTQSAGWIKEVKEYFNLV